MARLLVLTLSALLGHGLTQARATDLTLDAARKTLESENLPETIGQISLKGFEFSREIEVGGGLRVIAVSCNLGGGMLAFRGDGSLLNSITTNEIVGIRLLNLRGNKYSELVTEEVEGRGTGVLIKSFDLYVVSNEPLKRIWTSESYVFESDWIAATNRTKTTKLVSGYLRVDDNIYGHSFVLTYILIDDQGRTIRRETYEMHGDNLVRITIPLQGSSGHRR